MHPHRPHAPRRVMLAGVLALCACVQPPILPPPLSEQGEHRYPSLPSQASGVSAGGPTASTPH